MKTISLEILLNSPVFKGTYTTTNNIGYIYLMVNEATDSGIKIGKTRNPIERLYSYNRSTPYDVCKFIYLSPIYIDHHVVESKILNYIKNNITDPFPCRKEFFGIEHYPQILEVVLEAEKEFVIWKPD